MVLTDTQKVDLLIGIIIFVLIVIFKEFIILVLIPIAIYMYEYSINLKDLLQLLRDKALVLLYKLTKATEIGSVIANDFVEEVSKIEIDIKVEISKYINSLHSQFEKYVNNIIRQYIDKVVKEAMREITGFNEEEIVNKMSNIINATYTDILKEVNNKIRENNRDITLSISKIIQEYMQINKEENLEVINKEISKSIDVSMRLYNNQIKELVDIQALAVKNEVDKSVEEQLIKMKEEFKSNNIDIADLKIKLKDNIEYIMKNYIDSNQQKLEELISNLSKEFIQLKNNVDHNKVSYEVRKTLEEFKEKYIDVVQKNIDETIAIVKQLKELSCNTNNVEFIKNRDIRLKFEEALKVAEREILIVSPWMNYHVLVETNVKILLRRALERKVKIKIVYGIGSDLSANSGNSDNRNIKTIKVAEDLERDFKCYGDNFEIKRKNTHSKVLICDNKFALVTSFNLLSFSGDYHKDSREEIAAVIIDKDSINNLRLEVTL